MDEKAHQATTSTLCVAVVLTMVLLLYDHNIHREVAIT